MLINKQNYFGILNQCKDCNATLVAVSKTKPVEAILELYNLGHRDFGENYVQELTEKQSQLPKDINWHFIGHLQSNKVKYIASFIHLIHSVDSFKLLQEIQKQAVKFKREIKVLLQIHIAKEETKFGMNEQELKDCIKQYSSSVFSNVMVKGLMGMASFSNDTKLISAEFDSLKAIYEEVQEMPIVNKSFTILSMGMSSDYKLALAKGSTMIRVGSLLFGERT
jgi:pyridoxal phosphate enzyme (YggS family)